MLVLRSAAGGFVIAGITLAAGLAFWVSLLILATLPILTALGSRILRP